MSSSAEEKKKKQQQERMNFLKKEDAIFHANVGSNEERGERKNRTYITQRQNCFKLGHFS